MSNDRPVTEEQLDELMEWPAYIDKELMYTIENDCQEHCHSVNRRVLLSVLTMDSEKLFEACENESEAFFEGFKCSASTLGTLKRLVRLLDIGHNRLMLGLCCVDFNAAESAQQRGGSYSCQIAIMPRISPLRQLLPAAWQTPPQQS